MKQLKFMLAAATAISLATAAQAARFSGSTDFEGNFDLSTGFTFNGTSGDNESAIVPGVPSNTVDEVLTELAEANRPANHGFTATRANILQVNTGTEPIVRNIDGGTDVVLNGGAVYIDTLVKFTVTPENDTVEPTKVDGVIQDKLMVYLRDEGDAGKNLYVVAGYYDAEDVLKYDSYLIKSNVDPDVWHRLVVKAIDDISGGVLGGKFPGFQIYLDGDAESNMCVSDSYMADMTGSLTPETGMFLSMKSAESTASSGLSSVTLTSVGFAGEGKVDDLVISTFDPSKTVVDFTLTLAGDVADGLSGNATYASSAAGTVTLNSGENACVRYSDENVTISYSLAEGYKAEWSEGGSASFAPTAGTTYTLTVSKNAPSTVDFTFVKGEGVDAVTYTINDNESTAKVKAGDVIKITDVDYADLYVAGLVGKGYTKTISADEVAAGTAISVTVDAKALTGSGDGKVPEGTKAEDIGIINTAFENADNDQLNSLVKWATSTGKGSLELVNSMTFDINGNPEGDGKTAAEAYLLDCAANQNAIDEAMEDFVLTVFSIGADGAMTFGVGEGAKGNGAAYANGKIEVRGKAALNAANWVKDCPGAAFFKAFLVK